MRCYLEVLSLCLLIVLSVMSGGVLFAAQPYQPKVVNPLSESWRWKQFPELEGKGIRYIVESEDHRVWVGSNKGVLEYDGYDWKAHGKENGLDAAPVEQVLIAQDGSVYATASNGIFRYDGQQWEHFFQTPANLPFTFHRIEQLQNKSIIACADWGYIHLLLDGSIDFYTSVPKVQALQAELPGVNWIVLPETFLSESGNFVSASDVLETEAGEVWFALTIESERGKLLRFHWADVEDGSFNDFEVVADNHDFTLGENQSLLQARDGRIWVVNASSNKGILIFDKEKWETVDLSQIFGGGDDYLIDIVQSANGTIWMSSIAKIFAYTQGAWAMYKSPSYPVPANRIMLQNSPNDQLWVAGYKSTVLLLDLSDKQWLTYSDLSFQCESAPNEAWFLERNNRIVQRNDKVWTSFGEEDGLLDAPTRIMHTSQGQIWVAGSHRGKAATAVLREDGHWERHLHPTLSWGIDYRAVMEAQDGTLWFGAAVDAEKLDGYQSGILQLTNPTEAKLNWVHHRIDENGLFQGSFYGVGQSKDGRIWIGGASLYFYDGNKWQEAADERLKQYVNYVTSTDSLLLVGSRYYGVFIYDGETWTNYTTASGLSSNTIISIDALTDSVFIVATENGICKFDGQSWTQKVFPEELNMDFEGGTVYHSKQYIWLNHVPRGWKRRVYHRNCEEVKDWVFFTTRYRPSLRPPETVPVFYLEEVSADGNCIISWEGKDYFAKTAPENLLFSYRMDNGDWSAFSSEKQYTFTGLKSGLHILEVRARDLDFNVDSTPLRMSFEVAPPIWKQAWFIALILAFVIIYGVYEYRVITKKQKLEILNNSLSLANQKLIGRGHQIEAQNQEILLQQTKILDQSKVLEANNEDLEARNYEIRQQKEQLEEMVVQIENLSKAKIGFFTNISHELRTPLSLILGPIIQLRAGLKKMSVFQQEQLLNIIHKNASRLLKLINQLLEMRRIEHSTLALKLSHIDPASYLAEIVDLFAGLARRRGIDLDFDCKTDKLVASLDVDKLEKIVVNLLSNAFKHTPRGGRISVELDKVESSSDKALDTFYEYYLEIQVEDSGAGIARENIGFIFDKYFMGSSDASNTADFGIGLSYVKDLVYLMQGSIQVHSERGAGTQFTIYLPYINEVEHAAESEVLAASPYKHAQQEASLLLHVLEKEDLPVAKNDQESESFARILLVEDNQDMLLFLKSILQDKYQLSTAANGVEGLKLVRKHTFDLIISDVMMPKMDGLTFCEKVKNDFVTSHIPIILITAKALEDSRISGYAMGADDYIVKPFNPTLLLTRVENLLHQRKMLREIFNKELLLTPKLEKVVSPDEIFLQNLVNLINENLSDSTFNVEMMCKSMHLCHMHFIRKVKQLTGKKPIDLLRSFRMKKAKHLLAQKKLSVAEVAYSVGFDLPNSFSRAFKKEYKLTPSKFIATLEEKEEEVSSEVV